MNPTIIIGIALALLCISIVVLFILMFTGFAEGPEGPKGEVGPEGPEGPIGITGRTGSFVIKMLEMVNYGQRIQSGNDADLLYSEVKRNTLGNDVVYENGIFKINKSGTYIINYNHHWGGNPTGARYSTVKSRDGSDILDGGGNMYPTSSSTGVLQNGTKIQYVVAPASFSIVAGQNSGEEINVTNSSVTIIQIS